MSPETWYREIPPSLGDDPWQTWIKALDFPHRHQPLEAQVEYDVEAAIERADERRLSVWRGLTLSGIPRRAPRAPLIIFGRPP
jgi:hypothetical protein